MSEMMHESKQRPGCERAEDLMSFLYGEANEVEARDFEGHLKFCRECAEELASFGGIRESIGLWKEEALNNFVPPQVVAPVRQKSALAALREFFNLSPLWMKGAVGFAAVIFCALVVLVLARTGNQTTPVVAESGVRKYSEEEMQQSVAKALKEQEAKFMATTVTPNQQPKDRAPNQPKNRQLVSPNGSTQWATHL
jgi:anti-sigma factor RsiW